MSDSKFIISFFVLLAVGKTVMIIQCLRSRDRSTLLSSSSNSSPYASVTDMETGPEVLIEDPMTQRLVLAGEAAVDDRLQQPEMIDVIQIPPPVYTVKDEHLEFENDPPPPSFRDVVPSSSLLSPLSLLSSHPPKPPRRKPSRSSSSGSQSNNSTYHQHRRSRHQLFRYRALSIDSNSSNNNNQDAAEPGSYSGSYSGSSVRRPSATAAAVEPTILRIPNVARWVAESRRDVYQAIAGSSSSSEHYSFDFVSTYPDSAQHSEPYESSSTENMRILPSMGALYPTVIVHM
ncbi:hypothetical protein BGZ47_006538 [Haplosporangium gracile]|nr:hypothetical protein BGZ47_006538 [Haplosporangium gracile]